MAFEATARGFAAEVAALSEPGGDFDTAARKVGEFIGVHVIPRPVDGLGTIFPIE